MNIRSTIAPSTRTNPRRGVQSFMFTGLNPFSLRVLLATLTLLAISTFAVGSNADCIDYGDYIHRSGGVQLPGDVMDVAVVGDFAFVVDTVGLHVFGLDNPDQPTPIASAELPDARSVAVAGDHAYVVCDWSGLHVVNIADVAALWVEGSLPLSDIVEDVVLDGDVAYVAAEMDGLHVVDITDPGDPQLITTHDTPGYAHDVVIDRGYAFVADYNSLWILDLDNPRLQAQVSGGRPGPSYVAVAVRGDYAFIHDTTFGVILFDVSDPLAPEYLGNEYGPGSGRLVIAGDYLYVAGWPGLLVMNIQKPFDPWLVSKLNTSHEGTRGLAVNGDRVYVATALTGTLDVVDVSNPVPPEPIGSVYVPGWVSHLDVTDTHAYIACRYSGLKIANITDPSQPSDVHAVPVLEDAMDVVVDGDHAYVAGNDNGLYVVDISNPDEPFVAATATTPGLAVGIAVAGDLVYIATGHGVTIMNIAEPTAPWFVGDIETPESASDVAVSGSLAVVADDLQLLTVDVSDPTDPWIVDSVDAWAKVVALEGDLVYTANVPGLQIWSIADPAHMEMLGSIPEPGFPWDIALDGDYAYVPAVGGGMQIIDVGDPTAPTGVGSIANNTYGVAIRNDYLYVADSMRFFVFPLHCNPMTEAFQPERLAGEANDDRTGTDLAGGLVPGTTVLQPTQPNPFNPQTSIRFVVTQPDAVHLGIYDIAGHLVRELLDGSVQSAGQHQIVWDGRDDAGNTMQSGVYLVRLLTQHGVATEKISLVR